MAKSRSDWYAEQEQAKKLSPALRIAIAASAVAAFVGICVATSRVWLDVHGDKPFAMAAHAATIAPLDPNAAPEAAPHPPRIAATPDEAAPDGSFDVQRLLQAPAKYWMTTTDPNQQRVVAAEMSAGAPAPNELNRRAGEAALDKCVTDAIALDAQAPNKTVREYFSACLAPPAAPNVADKKAAKASAQRDGQG